MINDLLLTICGCGSENEYQHPRGLNARTEDIPCGRCPLGSVRNTKNFFAKTRLNNTFFKRSWHH